MVGERENMAVSPYEEMLKWVANTIFSLVTLPAIYTSGWMNIDDDNAVKHLDSFP
jgi:hypothetical protein